MGQNKNKFEKLKANRSQSKEEVCSQVQMKEFAWGVCSDDMGHDCASTSGNFKAISSSSLSFGGGIGGKGRKGVSDPKCDQ